MINLLPISLPPHQTSKQNHPKESVAKFPSISVDTELDQKYYKIHSETSTWSGDGRLFKKSKNGFRN